MASHKRKIFEENKLTKQEKTPEQKEKTPEQKEKTPEQKEKTPEQKEKIPMSEQKNTPVQEKTIVKEIRIPKIFTFDDEHIEASKKGKLNH